MGPGVAGTTRGESVRIETVPNSAQHRQHDHIVTVPYLRLRTGSSSSNSKRLAERMPPLAANVPPNMAQPSGNP